MNLLAKFEEVEVKPESRIHQEDKVYCEQLQANYDEFLQFANTYRQFLQENSVQNDFYSNKDLGRDIEGTIREKKGYFIGYIISHFRRTYQIELDSEPIQKKYKDTDTIHYTDILEEIFEQLGGVSLVDKTVQELIEKAKRSVSNEEITLNKNKLTLSDLVWWDYYSTRYRISTGDTNVYRVLRALSHFESGDVQLIPSLAFYHEMLTAYRDYQAGKFDKQEIADKVRSIKVFKNKKMEIVFATPDHAKEFAREYLGYSPSN